ncbi:hypothetical protein [Nocardioides insulae]|uniref:hypothetical protein n=1 Tax=Nocardioides insulae TaxID=394734 RepID=UPI0004266135|nr:hypothetical protein [Nocardioides insulae]
MNKTHATRYLLAAAVCGVVLTPSAASAGSAGSAATAQQRAAAPPTCSVRLVTTKAINLQHDVKGTDDVRARLGTTLTQVRPYTLGQRRNTLNDGTGRFRVLTILRLQVKVGNGTWLRIQDRFVRCSDHTRDLVFQNRDARYKARAVIDVLP